MIKVEPCKGCGGVLLVDRFMGVTVRCEAAPVDAQEAGRALLAGLNLYRVAYLGGRPSSFSGATPPVLTTLRTAEPAERPMVVVQHRCTKNASTAPQSASQGVGGPSAPKEPSGTLQSPPAAPGTLSPGRRSPSLATARTAAPRGSEPVVGMRSHPCCDGCGQPCADGTYASIELGDIMIWAHHVTDCEGRA